MLQAKNILRDAAVSCVQHPENCQILKNLAATLCSLFDNVTEYDACKQLTRLWPSSGMFSGRDMGKVTL